MNLNKSALLVLAILICFTIPTARSNLTVLKSLLSVFRSSPPVQSPAPSSPPSSPPTNAASNTAESINHHLISAEHLEAADQRSTLISEDDHKFSPTGVFKDGLFRGNFITRLQEMMTKRSLDASEESAIVNTEDVDQEHESEEDEEQNDQGLIDISNMHHDEMFNLDSEEDDEEEDDEEDELTSDFHKRNIADGSISVKNEDDLKESPRGKLVDKLIDELSKEIHSLLSIGKQSNETDAKTQSNNTTDVKIESNKIGHLNVTAEQEIKQDLSAREGSNQTHPEQTVPSHQFVQLFFTCDFTFDNSTNTSSITNCTDFDPQADSAEPIANPRLHDALENLEEEIKQKLNARVGSNQTHLEPTPIVQPNQMIDSNETADSNRTVQQPPVESSSNSTTSNLGIEQAENSVEPTIAKEHLLGNTLESVEKVLEKYNFLNLYPAPTINDTHNDRDLHQKDDERVILKANFLDYPGYANTEKSPINGQAPPVQNLTDITFGNVRVLIANSSDTNGDEKTEIIKTM